MPFFSTSFQINVWPGLRYVWFFYTQKLTNLLKLEPLVECFFELFHFRVTKWRSWSYRFFPWASAASHTPVPVPHYVSTIHFLLSYGLNNQTFTRKGGTSPYRFSKGESSECQCFCNHLTFTNKSLLSYFSNVHVNKKNSVFYTSQGLLSRQKPLKTEFFRCMSPTPSIP